MARKITSVKVYKPSTYTVATGDQVQVSGSNEVFRHLSKTVMIRRELGKPDVLSTAVIKGSPWAYGNLIKARTRLLIEYSDGSKEFWRVREALPDAHGQNDMEIEAWPIWADLGEIHLKYVQVPTASVGFNHPITRISVSDLLTNIAFNAEYGCPSFFNLTSVSADFASEEVNIESGAITLLELINSVSEQLLQNTDVTMEMSTAYNSGTNKVGFTFVREVGAVNAELSPSYNPDPSSRPIRGPGGSGLVNRMRLTVAEAQDDYYSRMLPFGGSEEELVSVEGVWFDIVSYTQGTKTFVLEPGTIPFDDMYVLDGLTGDTFFIETNNVAITTGSDTAAAITGTDASASSVTVANHNAGYTTATRLRFYSTLGKAAQPGTMPGSWVPFIHDPAAEADRGVVEAREVYSEVAPYENLFLEQGGSEDMSTWGAPTPGTVRGISSLPVHMQPYAPASAWSPYIIKLTGGGNAVSRIYVKGNYSGIGNGASLTFNTEWTVPAGLPGVDGKTWHTGTYTVNPEAYDYGYDYTPLLVVTYPVANSDWEVDTGGYAMSYDIARTSHTVTLAANHISAAQATDRDSAVYGTKSVQMTVNVPGAGVMTDAIVVEKIDAKAGYVSVWAAVKVASGAVKMQILDAHGRTWPSETAVDQQSIASGNTTMAMEIGGTELQDAVGAPIAVGASLDINVVFKAVSSGTVFTVDCLVVTQSSTPWEWQPYMGKKALYKAAAHEVARSGGLKFGQYTAEFVDASHIDPGGGWNVVSLGSWCRLYDLWNGSAYAIDVSQRVVGITEEFDLIEGSYWKTATINSKRPTLTDRIQLPKRTITLPRVPRGSNASSITNRYTVLVFQAATTEPSTPTGNTLPPTGWSLQPLYPSARTGYKLWMSSAHYDAATQTIFGEWSEPIQVDSPATYYIKPMDGTAIHNSTGTITLEAHILSAGVDGLLTSGDYQLYVGTDVVTLANGFVTGSDGYTGILDSGDISGSVLVELKSGPAETPVATITLVDITDGGDAVYGFVEADNGLAWTRATNSGAWAPVATETDLDFTFVQGGVDVCRDAIRVTRATDGTLTYANTTHTDDDVAEATFGYYGSGTTALTVTATYGGITIAATVITSQGGTDGAGGSNAKTVGLTAAYYVISYDAAGLNPTPSGNFDLTAVATNFTDPYFKFTGDEIADETTFTDGTGATDTFAFPVPASYSASPYNLRVGVAEAAAATVEVAFDSITIVSVKPGGTGAAGDDAYTVVLTNESHALPVSNTSVVTYTGSGTSIIAFRGTTELDGVTTGTPTADQFKVTATPTNITTGAISSAGNAIVVGDHSAMTATTASVSFSVNLGNLVTVTKIQTLSQAREGDDGAPGAAGTNSKVVRLTSAYYAIVYDANGSNPSPAASPFNVTAVAQNFTDPWFKFTGDVNTPEGSFTDPGATSTDTAAFTPPASWFSTPKNIRVGVSEGDQSEVAYDALTIVAVKPGLAGAEGADAYTVVLTNESHSFPASSDGTVSSYTGSGTSIIAFRGATELNGVTTGTPTADEFKVTATPTNITTGAISSAGNPIVVADHSVMTADTASISYSVNLGNVITVTKLQTFTKSKAGTNGSAGSDAITVRLTSPYYVIEYDQDGVNPSPAATPFNLTAVAQNVGTPWYKFTGDVDTPDGTFAVGATQAFTPPASYFATAKNIRVGVSNGDQDELAYDTLSILAVKPGTNSYTVIMTNESHTLPASSAGVVSSYAGSGTRIIAYKGSTKLTGRLTGESVTTSQFKVSSKTYSQQSGGNDVTLGAESIVSQEIVYADASAMTSSYDTATVDFTLSIEGIQTVIKRQTFTKSKAGVDPTLYYIKPKYGTAIKNGASSLVVEAHKIQGGTDSLLATGTIKLYDPSNAIVTTPAYDATGPGAETSTGYIGVLDASDINGSKIITLKDGAGGTALDTITLIDVDDGANGSNAVFGSIEASAGIAWVQAPNSGAWTPAGTTTDLTATFYQGGSTVGKESYRVTRASDGTLTGAVQVLGNEVNATRIAWATVGTGTTAFAITATYSFSSDTCAVSETILSAKGGTDGSPGANGYTVNVDNEAVTIKDNGSGPVFTGSGCTIKCFKGSAALTSQAGAAGAGQVQITYSASAGITADASPTYGTTFTMDPLTAMTVDNATITYTIVLEGAVTVTKVQTFVKTVDGAPSLSAIDVRVGGEGVTGQVLYLDASLVNANQIEYKVDAGTGTTAPTSGTGIKTETDTGRIVNYDLSSSPTSGTQQNNGASLHFGNQRVIWVRAKNSTSGAVGSWQRLFRVNTLTVSNTSTSILASSAGTGNKCNVAMFLATNKVGNLKVEYRTKAVVQRTATTTSASSNSVGTGAKTFTTVASLGLTAYERVHIYRTAASSNYMKGYVTSNSGTTLAIYVDEIGGSGTYSDWTIIPDLTLYDPQTATSSSSHDPATGSKTFTLDSATKKYDSGDTVRIFSSSSESTIYMLGTVTSYSGTTLVVNVTTAVDDPVAGPYTDWQIRVTTIYGPFGTTQTGTITNQLLSTIGSGYIKTLRHFQYRLLGQNEDVLTAWTHLPLPVGETVTVSVPTSCLTKTTIAGSPTKYRDLPTVQLTTLTNIREVYVEVTTYAGSVRTLLGNVKGSWGATYNETDNKWDFIFQTKDYETNASNSATYTYWVVDYNGNVLSTGTIVIAGV